MNAQEPANEEDPRTMTTAGTTVRNLLDKIRETTALQDEQLPSLESAITAFFNTTKSTVPQTSTEVPARTTTRPPRN